MRKFVIFALILFACSEETYIKNPCHLQMTISDALPVQFWLANCDTYNESDICGINANCFCQPFNSDDTIRVQFTDSGYLEDYFLRVLDANGSTLYEPPFTKTIVYRTQAITTPLQFYNNSFDVSISGWDQLGTGSFGTGEPFVWDNPSAALADGSVSNYSDTGAIGQERSDNPSKGWPPGTYQVSIKATNISVGGSAPLTQQLAIYAGQNSLDLGSSVSYSGTGTWDVGAGEITRTVSFTLTENKRYIWFQFYKQGSSVGYEVYFNINSIVIDSAPTTESIEDSAIYDWSFVPESEGITDQQIQLEIWNNTTPDVLIAKSDCLDIKPSHECSYLIEYSNHRNYAGLDYSNVSPDPSFYLRAPIVFFHERFPEEDEAIELSSRVIMTNSVMRAQRLLDTDFMPYYMHKKLQLVLKHQTVEIDGREWTKQDAYEIQDGNRLFPKKKAKCWLTEKDFIQRNVV